MMTTAITVLHVAEPSTVAEHHAAVGTLKRADVIEIHAHLRWEGYARELADWVARQSGGTIAVLHAEDGSCCRREPWAQTAVRCGLAPAVTA